MSNAYAPTKLSIETLSKLKMSSKPMQITDEIFRAFLNCETKAYLKSSGDVGFQSEFTEWDRNRLNIFKQKCLTKLSSYFIENQCYVGVLSPQIIDNSKYHLLFDCLLQTDDFQSHIHALERSTNFTKKNHNPFIPILFVPNEKITKLDKFQLSFNAYVLYSVSGKIPQFGKIIYSSELKIAKVDLIQLMAKTQNIINKIIKQQENPVLPQLILNKHCTTCEFQIRCHQLAIEKDELTLLSRFTEKERKRYHDKGIFTVTQLSYTFRARRRPKHLATKPEKYSHALKALAIREHKIYIAGTPEINIKANPVFLDVEGIPDQDFYYLIGLRYKSGDSYIQHSLWANEKSDEKMIWTSTLEILSKINNFQIMHYGSYETIFLKRMSERYADELYSSFVNKLINESINILSVIYSHLYFPTYSNGLKELARYLGFQWSDDGASGLNTLIWRSQWELTKNLNFKHKLVTYNVEDCIALEKITFMVIQLCQKQPTDETNLTTTNIVYTSSLKRESPYRFGTNKFVISDYEFINRAAYWDYQRDKIFVRSNKQLKSATKKANNSNAKSNLINKIVECPSPTCCSKCKTQKIFKHQRMTKIVYDLKIGHSYIKKWNIEYRFDRYKCCECGATFSIQEKPWSNNKYGWDLISFLIYQNIELRLSQHAVVNNLNQLFGFNFGMSLFSHQKTKVAQIYKNTYEEILKKIITGKLIHADETRVSIEGKTAYVWVFTNMEEVAYIYKETREGDFLQELLNNFNGVLVSDFYTAYDSINCRQQKCLIHLIRDMNDDLIKNPFNEELKEMIQGFAILLKPIIETIDRFGLKVVYLKKHKVFIERFYKKLSKCNYKSEIVIKLKKRLEKNKDKLFTFIDYDGIPWNNNNAEHAIKAFAFLRNVIGGKSSKNGINEYLILYSICQTCKYKGISFLVFLRSGEKDIGTFIHKHAKRRK